MSFEQATISPAFRKYLFDEVFDLKPTREEGNRAAGDFTQRATKSRPGGHRAVGASNVSGKTLSPGCLRKRRCASLQGVGLSGAAGDLTPYRTVKEVFGLVREVTG
jgi:hypothetical protein